MTIDCGFCDRPLEPAATRVIKVDGQPVPVHAFHVERRPPHRFESDHWNPLRCRICAKPLEGHAA